MIGKYTLEIGQKSDGTNDFVLGMGTSSSSQDGGFSNETLAVNLVAVPGVLYAPANTTDQSSILDSNIIAFGNDSNASPIKYAVTDTGKYYSVNTVSGASMTLLYNDSANNTKYVSGRTDIIQYRYKTYVTTSTNLNYFENQTLSTTHINWKTFTNAISGQVCNHPMIVWNGNLYIADGYQIHKVSGDTPTYTAGVLTLDTTFTIIALGIDPGSGKILISVTSQASNLSGAIPSENTIMLWDGFNPTVPAKTIPVEEMVSAFINIDGTVYILYGQNLGYFNGTGISFVRKLKNVALSLDIPYKNKVTSIGKTLFIVDGAQILAYGDIVGGKPPVSRYIYINQNNASTKLTAITSLGSGILGIASPSAKFLTFDINSVSTIYAIDFYSKRYVFPRPIFLRRVFIEYDTQITNGQTTGSVYLLTDNGTSNNLGSTLASGTQGVLELSARDIKTRSVQLRYTGNTVATGVRRFIIMYDTAE